MQNPESFIMSLAQVSRISGVPFSTLRRHASEGKAPPATKVANRWLFRQVDVGDWVATCQHKRETPIVRRHGGDE